MAVLRSAIFVHSINSVCVLPAAWESSTWPFVPPQFNVLLKPLSTPDTVPPYVRQLPKAVMTVSSYCWVVNVAAPATDRMLAPEKVDVLV